MVQAYFYLQSINALKMVPAVLESQVARATLFNHTYDNDKPFNVLHASLGVLSYIGYQFLSHKVISQYSSMNRGSRKTASLINCNKGARQFLLL